MADTPYTLGALPPIEHPSAYQWATHPKAGTGRPLAFDALVSAPIPVKDQGQTNSCVGHAVSETLEALHLAAGESDVLLSAMMPWQEAKQIENALGQNTGVYTHDALTAVRNLGICNDRLMPLSATDLAEMPTADALTDATTRTGLIFHQCQGRDELLTAMGVLGTPGIIAIAVYNEFFNAAADGTVQPFTGAIVGYHCIVLRGYDDTAQTVRIRNSWGLGWGDHGECVLTYAQLDACLTEAWAVQLPAKPTPQPTPPPEDPALAAWRWLAEEAKYCQRPDVPTQIRAQQAATVIAELQRFYPGAATVGAPVIATSSGITTVSGGTTGPMRLPSSMSGIAGQVEQ